MLKLCRSNHIEAVPPLPITATIYGVAIDRANPNPSTAVTYTDSAVGMTSGSSSWNNTPLFADIKPCVFKDGVVQYYLNPTNFTKKIDDTNATLSGNDGDVMIEFPKMGWKIWKDSTHTHVQMTRDPNVRGFRYLAHTRDTEGDRDYLYVGAYIGRFLNDKLRSVSGVTYSSGNLPTQSYAVSLDYVTSITDTMQEGYDELSFYPYV